MNAKHYYVVLVVAVASVFGAVTVAQSPPLEVKGIPLGASQQDIITRFKLDTVMDVLGRPQKYCYGTNGNVSCLLDPERIQSSRCPPGRTPNFGACLIAATEPFTFGPILPKSYSFTLREDKVVAVSVSIVTAAYDKLVIALTEKYGPPTKQSVESVQNRMGAKFENHKVSWERTDGFINVDERGSDLTEGRFLMSTREFMEAEANRSREAAKASASKL